MSNVAFKDKTNRIMREAGPGAARILRDSVDKRKRKKDYKPPTREILQVAKYIVDHAIGTSIQKSETLGKGGGVINIKTIYIMRPGLPPGEPAAGDIIDITPELEQIPEFTRHNKDSATLDVEPESETHTVDLDETDEEIEKKLG